jgi:small GTP-binding protein
MNWSGLIQQLYQIIHEEADALLLNELNELQHKIAENKFYLVIVGVFKRGKSSLINALLEAELAPVAITPLTALITIFEYGEQPYGKIYFLHGEQPEKISLQDIDDYVTETNNPNNFRQVRYVKIFYPSSLLLNISIIDTPGLGSILEHNTNTTLSFVPKIDAAVYVLSADTPVSKADLDFLKELQKNVPELLFVLNKIDMLAENELQHLLAYDNKVIAEVIKRKGAAEIETVSCRRNSVGFANITNLRTRIEKLAAEEKQDIQNRSWRNQFNVLRSQAAMQLRLQLDSFRMPVAELEAKQQKLSASVKFMQERQDEFESIIQSRVKNIQRQIDQQINELSRNLRREWSKVLVDNWKNTYDEMMNEGVKNFQEKMVKKIIHEFELAKQTLERETRNNFLELLEEYGNRSQNFLNELSGYLSSLMGIDFSLITAKFDLNIYTAFYFDYGKGEFIRYIYPSRAARSMHLSWAEKKFMQNLFGLCQQLITTNASGIIYDLQYRIQESFRKFNYDLNNYLEALLQSIEHIIKQTLDKRKNISGDSAATIERLAMKLSALDALPLP